MDEEERCGQCPMCAADFHLLPGLLVGHVYEYHLEDTRFKAFIGQLHGKDCFCGYWAENQVLFDNHVTVMGGLRVHYYRYYLGLQNTEPEPGEES